MKNVVSKHSSIHPSSASIRKWKSSGKKWEENNGDPDKSYRFTWHSVKCAGFSKLVQSPSSKAVWTFVTTKKKKKTRGSSQHNYKFRFFSFSLSLNIAPVTRYLSRNMVKTIVCRAHNERRIIKIPVVKNLRKRWMQKAIAQDTSINYRFVRCLRAKQFQTNEKKERKNPLVSSCVGIQQNVL